MLTFLNYSFPAEVAILAMSKANEQQFIYVVLFALLDKFSQETKKKHSKQYELSKAICSLSNLMGLFAYAV